MNDVPNISDKFGTCTGDLLTYRKNNFFLCYAGFGQIHHAETDISDDSVLSIDLLRANDQMSVIPWKDAIPQTQILVNRIEFYFGINE